MAINKILCSVVFAAALFGVASSHRPYPVSGSWFKNRNNATDLNNTLRRFASLGGDTVLLTGAEFKIRQPDDILNDPDFKGCVIDGVDCVASAKKLLRDKEIHVAQWLTYSNEENYTDNFAVCNGFDRRIQVGKKVYYQLILWTEDSEAEDCRFYKQSQVSVLFTYYSGEPDPQYLMLTQANALNISVHLGLPQPPQIRDFHRPTMNPFFALNYRIMADHGGRGFYNNTAMKGYYSDVKVIADHIINPPEMPLPNQLDPRDVLLLWRRLSFRAWRLNQAVMGAPSIDLTHASNTTLQGHVKGMKELQVMTMMPNFIIRDARGNGKAAYYWPLDYDQPISYRDKNLMGVLKQGNSSINDRTSYKDIYYASINEFLSLYINSSNPAWLMVEAYEDTENGESCGDSSAARRIDKGHLDRALTHAGSLVKKVTAYAWDPFFTCTTTKEKTALADQIGKEMNKSIDGECSFLDPPNNLTIAMTGFNLDSPGKFRVAYQFFTDKEGVNYIPANYIEKDYGVRNGLVDSLMYVEIPFEDFSDLARNGTIRVLKLDNYNSQCQFSYSLPDRSPWSVSFG